MPTPDPNDPSQDHRPQSSPVPGKSPTAVTTRQSGPALSAGQATVAFQPQLAESRDGPSATPPPSIPGFEIRGVLGRGGMGVVYKARQVSLNRTVALKMILAAEHAATEERERFRTEAQAIARLQHPGIVQIHEIGEHDGLPFFSMEYCAGGSSSAPACRARRLPAREAGRIGGATLARAMHAAHQAHVIHRDLTPANVLMAAGEAGAYATGVPKITDFGLARKLDEQGQTQTGAVMGTPSYMAPEQAEGKARVGPAADVYGLGAILYELLTGRPPFKAASQMDTLLQVINAEPVPPSQG